MPAKSRLRFVDQSRISPRASAPRCAPASARSARTSTPRSCSSATCRASMPALLDRLMAAFSPVEGRSICVPTVGGKRGNPVLWDAPLLRRDAEARRRHRRQAPDRRACRPGLRGRDGGRGGGHRHRHARGAGRLAGRGARHEFRRRRRPPPVSHPVRDHRRPAGALSRQRRLGADAAAPCSTRCAPTRRPAAPTCCAASIAWPSARPSSTRMRASTWRSSSACSRWRSSSPAAAPRRSISSPIPTAQLLKRGDRILLSELEHHSNIVPWQLLRAAERRRARHAAGHGRRPHRPRRAASACSRRGPS